MNQTDRISPRMTSLLPNSFAPQWRDLGERLALSAAIDLQRAKVRAVDSVRWLLQRDREITETSTSYVRGEKKRAFSAVDLLIGEVGMVLACSLVVLGAGSEIPMTIVIGFFLLSAIVFSIFAKRAVDDLLSQVEPEIQAEAALSAGEVVPAALPALALVAVDSPVRTSAGKRVDATKSRAIRSFSPRTANGTRRTKTETRTEPRTSVRGNQRSDRNGRRSGD